MVPLWWMSFVKLDETSVLYVSLLLFYMCLFYIELVLGPVYNAWVYFLIYNMFK